MVYDADALPCTVGGTSKLHRIVTPHPGEAGRILGLSTTAIQQNRFTSVQSVCAQTGAVALLKGRWALVASAGAPPISANPTGGPVLASAGTGDVLTGVVGALLARGCGARDAARLALWLHGSAGDSLARHRSEGWTASDVAAAIPDAIERLLATSMARPLP
jgi:NAD(P)H-hydrate epimerase